MRTILIVDIDDSDWNQFFAFKDDQDYNDALEILRPYEEVCNKIEEIENSEDWGANDEWDALKDKQDEMWTEIFSSLLDLSALYLEGVSESNRVDYLINR